jgi:hypothetical protein
MNIGFFDQQIPPTSDLKAELSEALGQAEVFVPLYSPGYFTKTWTLRERGVFLNRLATAETPGSDRHLIPVLWTPFPSWRKPTSVDEALELGEGIPEYAENGVRALRMLSSYRDSYNLVLHRLATKIIHAVEHYPIGPSPAADLRQIPAALSDDPAFIVTALTPRRARADERGSGVAWRPFAGSQVLPVAEYAASTAERLGLSTRVVDFDQVPPLVDRSPVVVIIDPRILADPDGEQTLRAAFMGLPEWVLPLVVAQGDDSRHSGPTPRLADRAMTVLESVRETTVPRTDGLEELVADLPRVITRARRAYLKLGPVWPPSGGNTHRDRLSDPNQEPSNEQRTDVDE